MFLFSWFYNLIPGTNSFMNWSLPADLHRIPLEHAVLFLCHIFTQRPMTDRKIERSYGRCFGQHQLLADSIKISFHMRKKKWFVAAQNLQSIKTLLTLELTQYRKCGSMFSSSEQVAARSDCCRFGNALCLCSPVLRAQAEQESCPKSLAVDFAL